MKDLSLQIYYSKDFELSAIALASYLSDDLKIDLFSGTGEKNVFEFQLKEKDYKFEKEISEFFSTLDKDDFVSKLKKYNKLILGIDKLKELDLDKTLLIGVIPGWEKDEFELNSFNSRYSSSPSIYIGSFQHLHDRFFVNFASLTFKNTMSPVENVLDLNLNVIRLLDLHKDSANKVYKLSKNKNLIFIKFLIFVKFYFKYVFEICFNFLNRRLKWNIGYLDLNSKESDLGVIKKVRNPKYFSFADPFVIEFRNQTVVFVEMIEEVSGKGIISVSEISSEKDLDFVTCIEEDFHLSFPFVFEYGSELYMVPESSQIEQLRLYRCTSFPYEWKMEKVLLSEFYCKDPILFFKDGLWNLFVSSSPLGKRFSGNELHVFHSRDLLNDNFVLSQFSPISTNSQKSRNGGFFNYNKDVFLLTQKHTLARYGTGIILNKLIKNNRNYSLQEVAQFVLKHGRRNLDFHHISFSKRYIFLDFKSSQTKHKKSLHLFVKNNNTSRVNSLNELTNFLYYNESE